MSGEFLPIQVIYEGKTTRCLSKCAFPENFDIKFSDNHWSNTEKTISFLKKVVFPHFKIVHQTKGFPNEQMSLVTIDTFKGQDNEEVAKLCRENNCVLIIVPHNLTNKFLPPNTTFNKPAKSFIKDKYNTWCSEQVTKQLNEGIDPADIEVSLNLSQVKPLHAN